MLKGRVSERPLLERHITWYSAGEMELSSRCSWPIAGSCVRFPTRESTNEMSESIVLNEVVEMFVSKLFVP